MSAAGNVAIQVRRLGARHGPPFAPVTAAGNLAAHMRRLGARHGLPFAPVTAAGNLAAHMRRLGARHGLPFAPVNAAGNLAAHMRRIGARHGLPFADVAFAGLGRDFMSGCSRHRPPALISAPSPPSSACRSPICSALDAPNAAPSLAPCAHNRKDDPLTPDIALAELRALLDHARASDAAALSIPLDLADAVARSADRRAADLLAVLGALDFADCSPRMILRRAALIGRLRLDASDAEARAQAADLCDAAMLRRQLRDALADAVEAEDKARAEKLRAIFIAADDETLGWQGDALTAIGERG